MNSQHLTLLCGQEMGYRDAQRQQCSNCKDFLRGKGQNQTGKSRGITHVGDHLMPAGIITVASIPFGGNSLIMSNNFIPLQTTNLQFYRIFQSSFGGKT